MLKKNIEREKRKQRPTFVGCALRFSPTKKEKLEKIRNKHKGEF